MDNQSFTKPGQTIAVVVLIGLLSGIGGSLLSNQFIIPRISSETIEEKSDNKPAQIQKTYIEESQSIDSIKKVSPAVVSIVASQDLKVYYNNPFPFYSPFGGMDSLNDSFPGFQFRTPQRQSQNPGKEGEDYEIQQKKVSGGSGFIMSSDGLVLTNRHVVSQNNVEYTIISNDGTEYDGEIVSIDPLNDLAVIQMIKKGELKKAKADRTKLDKLTTVELGDSSKLEVGQKVLAIVYALGEYQNTVTSGIISAKGREITASGRMQSPEKLNGLLQTDAAINPGNSGGPLINLAGQVIGVNVAIDATGSGIGFAIPSDDIKNVIESIKKYGRIVRPSLGVRHIILSKAKAKELDINVDHGALLVGDESKGEFAVVPGSAADKAGLKIKDVILSIDEKDITVDFTLQDAISNHKPGDEITIKVWRSGDTKTMKAKLTETKEEEPQKSTRKSDQ